MISKELHSRCFPDNFWLTWLRTTGFWTKNRSNKSFQGDKLKLLNSRRGKKSWSQLRPVNNPRRPQREAQAWQHVNITLSASLWTQLFGKSHLPQQLYAQNRQWTFDECRRREKKWAVDLWDRRKTIWKKKRRKKKVRQDFFVDHCQCVYWTRRCCLTFGS